MQPFETYEHAGLTVELHYDDSAFDPRKDWDHLGTIISFTRDLDGDEYISLPEDGLYVDCQRCEGFGENQGVECLDCEGAGEVEADSVEDYIAHQYDAIVAIPLRYSNYGFSSSELCESDQDPNAVIYLSKAVAAKEGMDVEQVRKYMRAEVEEYDHYLKGEVYGYVIKGPDGEDLPDKFHDSCWGFIGDISYVTEQANEAAEYVATQLAAETAEAEAMAARDIITI